MCQVNSHKANYRYSTVAQCKYFTDNHNIKSKTIIIIIIIIIN
jgi:hypothetical protein